MNTAAALVPEELGRRLSALVRSHEELRAELYRARRQGQTRIVLTGDDVDGYEFGADGELAGHCAFVIREQVYLVGTAEVLAAAAQALLAEVAALRARSLTRRAGGEDG